MYILNQDYDNYNIIIFLKNITDVNLESSLLEYKKKYNNIFIFSNTKLTLNIDIIIFLTKYVDNNSLIVLIDNNYLINPLFSLLYINLLFFTKNISITDYYSNNSNLLVFKKELLLSILSNYEYIDIVNFDKEYLVNLTSLLKKELYILDQKNIYIPINNEPIDNLLFLYKSNYIDYKEYDDIIYTNLNNIILPIQMIIFINSDIDISIDKIHTKLEKINKNIQINIIHFDENKIKNIEDFNNINYIFLKIKSLNKSFAYNMMFNIFTKYLYSYQYILFHDIETELNYINLNNFDHNTDIDIFNINGLSSFIIKKDLFEKVGGYDPEIFLDNSGYETIFFLEKIKKFIKIDLSINTNIDTKSIFINFYKSVFNFLAIFNESQNSIFLNFLKKRNIINYNLWNNIKTYLINLDEREDRFTESWYEMDKIELYNFEKFSGIKINNNNELKDYNIINHSKLWKKNDIEYLKSALGCKLSHLEILKKSLSCTEEYILILEDDVVFENNTIIYLNLALLSLKNIDWDILFLSTNLKNKDDATKIGDNLLKLNKGLTTTAQLFKRKNIEKIIKIIENSECEIDNTYNDLLENKFCVYPMCCYQRESYSDINKNVLNYGLFHKKYEY
jgi:GR25 family glycosyltransferase involved in LPS biosynthesis